MVAWRIGIRAPCARKGRGHSSNGNVENNSAGLVADNLPMTPPVSFHAVSRQVIERPKARRFLSAARRLGDFAPRVRRRSWATISTLKGTTIMVFSTRSEFAAGVKTTGPRLVVLIGVIICRLINIPLCAVCVAGQDSHGYNSFGS